MADMGTKRQIADAWATLLGQVGAVQFGTETAEMSAAGARLAQVIIKINGTGRQHEGSSLFAWGRGEVSDSDLADDMNEFRGALSTWASTIPPDSRLATQSANAAMMYYDTYIEPVVRPWLGGSSMLLVLGLAAVVGVAYFASRR